MKSLKRIVDKLIRSAFAEEYLYACPNSHQIKTARKEGQPISDHCLPGRLIQKLSKEEREILQSCTAKDFNHRIGR